MAQRSLIPAKKRSHAWGRGVSIAFLCGGLAVAFILALLGYVAYAVWVIAALLAVFAFLRALLPGRPWFSSRNKIVDVCVLGGLAIAIAYFSQWAEVAAVAVLP